MQKAELITKTVNGAYSATVGGIVIYYKGNDGIKRSRIFDNSYKAEQFIKSFPFNIQAPEQPNAKPAPIPVHESPAAESWLHKMAEERRAKMAASWEKLMYGNPRIQGDKKFCGINIPEEDIKAADTMKGARNASACRPNTPDEDFKQITDSLFEVLKEKNKRYGNSAGSPLNIFGSKCKVGQRLDDKLARIKNSEQLRKNDVFDLMGYLVHVCREKGFMNFRDQLD